jgi:NAD(P)-dependent dehydrogenase (short-subunit alcohol dehydrogenase family)
MGILDGRVAIITGAGRGLGREHALLFAREGALVVVNDAGVAMDGTGRDLGPAERVVEEIRAAGGKAVANHDDVADFEGARSLVQSALDAFGQLHVLVNNAGILRDRMVANMTEEEWDAVIAVHLKGHFCPTRWAAAYWRDRAKAGDPVRAAIVNTSSSSGLYANYAGQTNYGAAKAGIAAFTLICARELDRYGVRVNAIAPAARTRMTTDSAGTAATMAVAVGPGDFDIYDPANVSPAVAALAAEDCPLTGRVFHVRGGAVTVLEGWRPQRELRADGRWDPAELLATLVDLTGGQR